MHGHFWRTRLRELGLRPRGRLSQAFLEDERIAAAIVRAARLDKTRDQVLEVGPGLGALTQRLADAAHRVVAIEIDPALADALRAELSAANVTVCTADVLRTDIAALFTQPFVVVANLPYHITSPVLRHLLAAGPPSAARLVIMVQKEVGDRISAAPGDMSALAVITQAQARVTSLREVPRSAFYPPPKVDSVVLRLEPIEDVVRVIRRAEIEDFSRFVHAGFKQPRKQLANSLSEGLGVDKADAVALLSTAQVEPTRRPQQLGVPEWAHLFRAWRARR